MKPFLLLVILCTLSSCYNQERDCKKYQTGNYISDITINDSVYRSTFTRTKTLQIEEYNGKIDSTNVRWINDCEVIFKTINPKTRVDKKDIHLKILTTTDSSYTFEYSYVGESNKQKGIALKLD